MGFVRRHSPNDLIYLIPVQIANEQLPEDKIRILFCDAKGDIRSAIIDNSAYELAKSCAEELEHARKNYAILSVEITPGESVPCAVGINPEQVWALEHILEHAIKRRKTPDILKRYLKEIMQTCELKRKELESQHERAKEYAFTGKTPEVLHRLPYYTEEYTEAAVPIYKAHRRYPIIFLRRLPPNEQTIPDTHRLLTLDSDGDLAIIGLPFEAIDEAERIFGEWKRVNKSEGCIVYSRHQDGFMTNYLGISELQRKALDSIAQHFVETGYGQQPISLDAQEVLARVKEYGP